MSPSSDGARAAKQVEGLYSFSWAGEDGDAPRKPALAKLRARLNTGIARSVAMLPDGFLESALVKRVILKSLPYVLRLRFHRSLATTVTGSDFTTRSALGLVFSNSDRIRFLVDIQDRRCRVSKIPNEQVPALAEAGLDMPMPKLMRMFVGAEIHPALLIDNGDIRIWGDVFVIARLIPMFSIPPRSLLSGDDLTARSSGRPQ